MYVCEVSALGASVIILPGLIPCCTCSLEHPSLPVKTCSLAIIDPRNLSYKVITEEMKENTGWKMDNVPEQGTRRPQTAVWKIPKSDTRREKYCKSAREHGPSYHTQSPRFLSSPSSSYESSSSSQVIDLHASNGTFKLSNSSLHIDRRLPQIHNSADLFKSNMSTNSGSQHTETYLTSVDIKIPWYISVLHEKEHCLLKLGEEINRLSRCEVESKRKDQIISALRSEVSQLHCSLQQSSHSPGRTAQDGVTSATDQQMAAFEEHHTLADMQETSDCPSSIRDDSIASPRNIPDKSLSRSVSETQMESTNERISPDITAEDPSDDHSSQRELGESAGAFRGQFDNVNEVIEKLQGDIEKTKKDYEMSKGVISSLQKIVSVHESKLRKSESEKEVLQRELRERELQIHAMSNKFSSMREERKHGELLAGMEKENFSLRELSLELKSEVARRTDMIAELKTEIHRLQKEVTDYQSQRREQQEERRQLERRVEDLVASEQHVRVMLEAVQSKFERFRSKIIQAAYTAPGFKGPQMEVSDAQILDTMQRIIAERSDYHQQLKQKGVNVPPLYVSESAPAVKQTSSSTRRKAV